MRAGIIAVVAFNLGLLCFWIGCVLLQKSEDGSDDSSGFAEFAGATIFIVGILLELCAIVFGVIALIFLGLWAFDLS